MHVRNVLDTKGHTVFTVHPDQLAGQLPATLRAERIGA